MSRRDPPTPEQLERWQRNKQRVEELLTQPPVLIGGCGRSGTTLLLSVMSAHPQVFAIGQETNVFCPNGYHASADFSAALSVNLKFYDDFDALQPGGGHDRWCEKTPKNVLFFPQIVDHFNGNVRLLHIIRDGRDVVTSRHPYKKEVYWVSVERWVTDVSAGVEFAQHPLVHTVRYEELIRDNDRVVRGICDFLELPWCAEMADWHKHATVRENAAWDGEVKPLFESSIGKWKKDEHAERLNELMSHPQAKRLLGELGYLD